jgi:hypothetical protein
MVSGVTGTPSLVSSIIADSGVVEMLLNEGGGGEAMCKELGVPSAVAHAASRVVAHMSNGSTPGVCLLVAERCNVVTNVRKSFVWEKVLPRLSMYHTVQHMFMMWHAIHSTKMRECEFAESWCKRFAPRHDAYAAELSSVQDFFTYAIRADSTPRGVASVMLDQLAKKTLSKTDFEMTENIKEVCTEVQHALTKSFIASYLAVFSCEKSKYEDFRSCSMTALESKARSSAPSEGRSGIFARFFA